MTTTSLSRAGEKPVKQKLRDYIRQALDGFRSDPPDSDFQRGYESALEEVERVFFPEGHAANDFVRGGPS